MAELDPPSKVRLYDPLREKPVEKPRVIPPLIAASLPLLSAAELIRTRAHRSARACVSRSTFLPAILPSLYGFQPRSFISENDRSSGGMTECVRSRLIDGSIS